MPKNFGFGVHIAICGFSVFYDLVFGFRKKHERVFVFGIRCGFRFFPFGTSTTLIPRLSHGVTGTLKALNRKYERCESIMNVLSRAHQ